MRKVLSISWVLLVALIPFLAAGAMPPQQEAANPANAAPSPGNAANPPKDLAWAFPVPDKVLPAAGDEAAPKHLPGSSQAFTPAQIDDLLNPPDWFPADHPPAPKVIQHGQGSALACGSCHLMSGLGHPESANLTGFSAEYIDQQMEDFRTGARKDAARMNAIAAALSDSESKQAGEWFAMLKPAPYFKVMEADTVPKTYVNRGRMRLPSPDGGTEPLGDRIVELPQDPVRTENRDPHSGFIAYAPVGSLAKGEKLVMAGGAGKTIGCDNCHGPDLKGDRYIPSIAGRSPGYMARQLYGFQHFTRNGPGAGLMQPVVKDLTPEDILDIAAYLASVPPERAKAAK